jgi:hypothetical protein
MSLEPAHKAQSENKAMTTAVEKTEVVSIDPSYVTVFRAEAASRNMDLSDYRFHYFETEKSFIISAIYKNKPPRMKGSVEGHRDCNGEIDKTSKRLLRFWYSR